MGQKIKKFFPQSKDSIGGWYGGKINRVDFDSDSVFFHIRYDDGDAEELEPHDFFKGRMDAPEICNVLREMFSTSQLRLCVDSNGMVVDGDDGRDDGVGGVWIGKRLWKYVSDAFLNHLKWDSRNNETGVSVDTNSSRSDGDDDDDDEEEEEEERIITYRQSCRFRPKNNISTDFDAYVPPDSDHEDFCLDADLNMFLEAVDLDNLRECEYFANTCRYAMLRAYLPNLELSIPRSGTNDERIDECRSSSEAHENHSSSLAARSATSSSRRVGSNPEHGTTLLHVAALLGSVNDVKELLADSHVNVRVADRYGNTALHCVFEAMESLAQFLLTGDENANLNNETERYLDVAKLLLGRDASLVTAQNVFTGLPALSMLVRSDVSMLRFSALAMGASVVDLENGVDAEEAGCTASLQRSLFPTSSPPTSSVSSSSTTSSASTKNIFDLLLSHDRTPSQPLLLPDSLAWTPVDYAVRRETHSTRSTAQAQLVDRAYAAFICRIATQLDKQERRRAFVDPDRFGVTPVFALVARGIAECEICETLCAILSIVGIEHLFETEVRPRRNLYADPIRYEGGDGLIDASAVEYGYASSSRPFFVGSVWEYYRRKCPARRQGDDAEEEEEEEEKTDGDDGGRRARLEACMEFLRLRYERDSGTMIGTTTGSRISSNVQDVVDVVDINPDTPLVRMPVPVVVSSKDNGIDDTAMLVLVRVALFDGSGTNDCAETWLLLAEVALAPSSSSSSPASSNYGDSTGTFWILRGDQATRTWTRPWTSSTCGKNRFVHDDVAGGRSRSFSMRLHDDNDDDYARSQTTLHEWLDMAGSTNVRMSRHYEAMLSDFRRIVRRRELFVLTRANNVRDLPVLVPPNVQSAYCDIESDRVRSPIPPTYSLARSRRLAQNVYKSYRCGRVIGLERPERPSSSSSSITDTTTTDDSTTFFLVRVGNDTKSQRFSWDQIAQMAVLPSCFGQENASPKGRVYVDVVRDDDPRKSLHGQATVRAARCFNEGEIVLMYAGLVRSSDEKNDGARMDNSDTARTLARLLVHAVKQRYIYDLQGELATDDLPPLRESRHVVGGEQRSPMRYLFPSSGKSTKANAVDDISPRKLVVEPFPFHGNVTMLVNDCSVQKKSGASGCDKVKQNCEFREVTYWGFPYVAICAVRPIRKGQELLLDYGAGYWNHQRSIAENFDHGGITPSLQLLGLQRSHNVRIGLLNSVVHGSNVLTNGAHMRHVKLNIQREFAKRGNPATFDNTVSVTAFSDTRGNAATVAADSMAGGDTSAVGEITYRSLFELLTRWSLPSDTKAAVDEAPQSCSSRQFEEGDNAELLCDRPQVHKPPSVFTPNVENWGPSVRRFCSLATRCRLAGVDGRLL
eukprot:g2828.t1